jgi:hypothetical protein
MMKQAVAIGTVIALSAAPVAEPAEAAELFGGIYAHDVDTALTRGGFEGGVDLQLGVRGNRLEGLRAIGAPSPHLFVSANSRGDTNFASAGISWKVGETLYLRPGVGLAVHDRSSRVVRGGIRADFGSRLLFAPEVGIGYQLNDRISVEASWVHLSHAQLLSRQNPGMDDFGLRLNYRFR